MRVTPFLGLLFLNSYCFLPSSITLACHIAVSQIQKRDELDVELYINDDPDLYNSLLENKENIESLCGLSFDWRELPDRKASRIVLEKSVQFANKSQWESQFEWLVDVMVKMKAAFCKHI